MFSETIVQLLQSRNISAYRLSKDTGIPQSLLSLYKNGEKMPSVENLRKIADYFGVSVDYLLGRSPDIKEAPAGNPEGAETEDPSSDELRRRISEALSRLDPSYLEIVAAQIDALQALQESREEKGSLHD